MRVAFLGLGIMGQSMASNLVKAGHDVTVWNRTPGKLVEGAGIAPTPLDIVLSRKPGRIEGVVVNNKHDPVAGIRTILIPDQNRDRIGLYKFGETDQAGRFTIRGITPGAYKVFAWEALEEWAFVDLGLMQRFELYGTPVRVSESDELRTEVKLIPAGM